MLYFWPYQERLTALPFSVPSPTGTQGTGTISSKGTTVYGSGTNFLGNLIAGDMIIASGQSKVVTQIASGSSSLTVNSAFNTDLPPKTPYNFKGYFVNPLFDNLPPPGSLGYAGGSLVITGSGPSNEVIWAVVAQETSTDGSQYSNQITRTPGYLFAYNSYANGLTKIWGSANTAGASFCASPFALPTVVNGNIYVPTYALSSTCPVTSLSNSGLLRFRLPSQ